VSVGGLTPLALAALAARRETAAAKTPAQAARVSLRTAILTAETPGAVKKLLSLTENAPGMSPKTRRRCLKAATARVLELLKVGA
jgi:hypothetical protein